MGRSLEKERYWRDVFSRQSESGLSPRAFCLANQIRENQYYAWRRKLEQRDRQQDQLPHPPVSKEFEPPFLPMQLVAPSSGASSSIELVWRDAWRVAVLPGFDPPTLARVLRLLENRGC